MKVTYHIGRVSKGLQPERHYTYFLKREGPENGKLSSSTFEGLILGMVEAGYLTILRGNWK